MRSTLLLSLSLLLVASVASAQPKGTVTDAPVSKGKTDVTTDSFTAAAVREDEKDATELAINGGALIASGNSKSLAVTAGTTYRLRREDNQLSFAGAGNYSRAAIGRNQPVTTVENLQGRLRYDRFFAKDWTVFLGVQGRRDRFAGLDLRLQVDPGVGYYFINLAERVFWAELGYDLLHDVRRDDARQPKDANGVVIPGAPLVDKTSTVHSGRAFLGYKYNINEGVSLGFGLEFLQGISDTAIRRVNGDAVVMSKFTDSFALATSFLFRYDNKPLPGKEQIDTISSVSLVYTLL
jgi:putative salt-induced outer membrane protein YdiY